MYTNVTFNYIRLLLKHSMSSFIMQLYLRKTNSVKTDFLIDILLCNPALNVIGSFSKTNTIDVTRFHSMQKCKFL